MRGSAPYEAMVIVANHSSHADTPALIAAFPAPYKPVVVAAEDYWFEKAWMRLGLKLAIGAVPVHRKGGGYGGLVDGAQTVLGAGSSLLVFPEGTRSTDGRLGELRSGAVRIAREFDVPILPVAIVGTRDLLPKGGGLHPGPVEVRLGHPIQPEDLVDDDMSPVVAPARGAARRGPRDRVAVPHVEHPAPRDGRQAGMAGAAAWGFAEAVSWPVTMEMYLAVVGVANPRRILPAAAWLTAGSVAGVLVTAELTRRGLRPPAPLTTATMRDAAATAHGGRCAGRLEAGGQRRPGQALRGCRGGRAAPRGSRSRCTRPVRGVRVRSRWVPRSAARPSSGTPCCGGSTCRTWGCSA